MLAGFAGFERQGRAGCFQLVERAERFGAGTWRAVVVGIDGIAFATAKSTPLSNVTTRDIYMAIAKTPFGKPNRARTWKDVNPKLPALPIRVYGPPPTSGTRDALTELILTAGCGTNPGMQALAKTDSAYKQLAADPKTVEDVLQAGARKARAEAQKTTELVRTATGFSARAA